MELNKGYVYIMYNPSYEGIVKIGKTTRDPEERAKELSSATGVATPFVVAYKRVFNDCDWAEKVIHEILTEKGLRVNDSREFFSLSISDAIDILLALPDCASNSSSSLSNIEESEKKAEDIEDLKNYYYDKASDYEYGTECIFIDYTKAIEYYQKAADLGHFKAYERIGDIYYYNLNITNRAIDFYKKAVDNGNFLCYVKLGCIFMSDEKYANDTNSNIAWQNFLKWVQQTKESNIEWPETFLRNLYDGCRELVTYHIIGGKTIPENWKPLLKLYKSELIEYTYNLINFLKQKGTYGENYIKTEEEVLIYFQNL